MKIIWYRLLFVISIPLIVAATWGVICKVMAGFYNTFEWTGLMLGIILIILSLIATIDYWIINKDYYYR